MPDHGLLLSVQALPILWDDWIILHQESEVVLGEEKG